MRKDRGITLIALTITIIVLMILTAVSIEVINGSLFDKADEYANNINEKTNEEINQIEEINNTWNEESGTAVKSPTAVYQGDVKYSASGVETIYTLTGESPLTFDNSVGESLVNYRIYGNTVQDGTPSMDNPVEMKSVGDLVTDENDANYGKYKITIKVNDTRTNIYLDEPLRKIADYADYIDFISRKVVRKIYYEEVEIDTLGTSTYSKTYKMFGHRITNKPLIVGSTSISKGFAISDRFISSTYQYKSLGSHGGYIQSYIATGRVNMIYFTFADSTIQTIEDGVAQFDEPLKVCYALNTQIEESIDLPELLINGNTNTIEVETEIQPSNIELQYMGLASTTTTSHGLPSEYQEVKYIESTGTQYIDTGIKANQDTGIDIKFLSNNILSKNSPSGEPETGYGTIFGGRKAAKDKDFALTTYNNVMSSGTLRYNTTDNAANLTNFTLTHISFRNGIYTDNKGNTSTITRTEFTTPVNVTIFALNNNGTITQYGSLKLYYFKIYDGDLLIRYFVPCYRKSDNEPGLYDKVNGVFYTNAGTGEFLYSE